MVLTFASKDFETGLIINFIVYKIDGTLVGVYFAHEIGNTGVYYVEWTTLPIGQKYIILAREYLSAITISYKYIQT